MSDALRVSAQSGTRRQGASVSYLGTPTTPLSLSAKGLLATEGGPNCAGSVQLGTDFVGDNRVSGKCGGPGGQ